jgi:hypothetical protein
MVLLPFQLDFAYAICNGRDGCTPEKEEEVVEMQIRQRDVLDVPAVRLSMETALKQEGREQQFEKMFEQRRSGWRIGVLAACICQHKILELEPHQTVPAHITLEDRPQPRPEMEDAAALVRKLVAADVSRLHPDPVAAYKKATGKSLF